MIILGRLLYLIFFLFAQHYRFGVRYSREIQPRVNLDLHVLFNIDSVDYRTSCALSSIEYDQTVCHLLAKCNIYLRIGVS